VHDPNQTVITEAEIGYLIVIEIQLVAVILRDDMVGGSVDDFPCAGFANASTPTPAAVAANAYMLSCWWIDSERLAVLRGREGPFINLPRLK
jgi:hypothetical protein